MLSTKEQKVIMHAICIEAIIKVPKTSKDVIIKFNKSNIFMQDLVEKIWENRVCRLHSKGNAKLCERQKLVAFVYHHRTCTILRFMRQAQKDLRDLVPKMIDLHQLLLWDSQTKSKKQANEYS